MKQIHINKIPLQYWIKKMFDIRSIMYPVKKKGQSKYIRNIDTIIIETEQLDDQKNDSDVECDSDEDD